MKNQIYKLSMSMCTYFMKSTHYHFPDFLSINLNYENLNFFFNKNKHLRAFVRRFAHYFESVGMYDYFEMK